MSSGNPAGRLLGIIEEARELSDNTSVMLLPEQAMAEVREHYPEEEKEQEYWVGQVNKALFQSVFAGQQWSGVKKHLDDHIVRYLKMAAALLKRRKESI